jgi:hypothetical protein
MNSTLTQKSSPYNYSYKRTFFLFLTIFSKTKRAKYIFFSVQKKGLDERNLMVIHCDTLLTKEPMTV